MSNKKHLLSFGTVTYDRYLKYVAPLLHLTYDYLKTLSREELYALIKQFKLEYTLHITDY